MRWSGELRWGFLENEGTLESFWRWRRGPAWTGSAEFWWRGSEEQGRGTKGARGVIIWKCGKNWKRSRGV